MDLATSTQSEMTPNTLKIADRRRTIRLRRSAITNTNLESIDRPSIKFAETAGEFIQSFRLSYDAYSKCGYITDPVPEGLLYSLHNLVPSTRIFVFKTYLSVVSTLSQYFDSQLYGLPMDSLYRRELDVLRDAGRSISEIGALATISEMRRKNLVFFLFRVMLEYSRMTHVDDLCITVNPKHVSFYQEMLLFEVFGEERFYPSVGAPAVALRINVPELNARYFEKYGQYDVECNLHQYFCMMNDQQKALMSLIRPSEKSLIDLEFAQQLISAKPEILENCSEAQRQDILARYAAK